ncbi:MAG: hypothetical protein CVT63_00075 [Candidatus Anoxymicrobium japonicum]|uniref:Glycosyltransferase RgtA/B/C/D-like domain-containing protein n=1 Tax=Candidatus Anoxymicrobium japonicum TaxID=2013648 RepID=A0A2N3G8B0_9ACTN|nr:MAG: hypothetical protein CVT63_00075 [Candidatus Anoxymicrobium japonicum]
MPADSPARLKRQVRERKLSERVLRLARQHRAALVVIGIMLVAFLLRLHYLSKHTEHTADSYYFLILARSIRDTFTYMVRGVAHTKYLPGYPIMIWLGSYIFGDLARSANMIALLGGTFTALATYGIGRELFNKWTGVVAAVVVAFQPTFLKWTVLSMTEGLFTFLFAAGVYLLLTGCKRASPARRALGAAAGGLCFLVRWEGMLFLPIMGLIALIYIKDSKFRWWEPALALFAFGAPMSVYVARNLIETGKVTSYVGEFKDYSTQVSYQVLKHRTKVYAWNGMSDALFSALFFIGAAYCLARRKWKGFLVAAGWFGIFVGFHLFWYYAYERFMAPAVPAVGLIIGFMFVDMATLSWAFFSKARERESASPARSAVLSGARVACLVVLAALLVTVVSHGLARADLVIKQNYLAFADDHGGRGMEQAAGWLDRNARGETVACDAGPYFRWLYYPGDVLYMRPVPWDLPVEPADVTCQDAVRQLNERGVRYIVIGQTEKGVDDELGVFGIVGAYRSQIREVKRWVNHYDYPSPHDLTTVIFEIVLKSPTVERSDIEAR